MYLNSEKSLPSHIHERTSTCADISELFVCVSELASVEDTVGIATEGYMEKYSALAAHARWTSGAVFVFWLGGWG